MTRLLAVAVALQMLVAPAIGAEIGDDGLHKTDWMRETFKDLREDLAEANAEGKRLIVIVEQRGCVYCTEMHEKVFPREDIASYLRENYFVVQMNLHGSIEVTDFDGDVRQERDMTRKWRLMFTPTMMFFPEEVPEGMTAPEAAVVVMPGAFYADTLINLLTWVNEKRYENENEDFQRYHARMLQERGEPTD
jgi:thioredoxin-related protein